MMGQLETEERGIIPRLIEGIFRNIELADESIEFTVGKGTSAAVCDDRD